jgi:sulfide:quinone oxidoreductase
MTVSLTQRTSTFATAPQISTTDMQEIAEQGYKTVINNRPDGEGGSDQPLSAEVAKAAAEYGIDYVYLPVISGQITEAQVAQFAELLATKPGPILAFCRSGARSMNIYQMASSFNQQTATTASPAATAPACNWQANHDVVIVGGGSAGIGLAASLLKRQPGLQITIIEPKDKHYYQPAWTLVGAGEFDPAKSERNMADVMPKGVNWIRAAATGFDPVKKEVQLDTGSPITYQNLIVAPGLQLNWKAIEGLEATLGKNGVTSNYRFDLASYTWSLVQSMKSGKAIFTQPPMPIKCAGAPQKAMYLSCSEWEHQGKLKNIQVEFNNAGAVLFGVADFVPPLMEYVKRYQINLQFNSKLVAVDGPAKKAWFEIKDAQGNLQRVEKSFDMLHVVPPQIAPDFIRQSSLANAEGWVEVDQTTLQHVRHADIFSLGDACSSPNAKTAAAARKQIVVVAENLLAMRAGRPLPTRYDGYGSCPLTVEKGRIVLAEFGFGGKLLPTFPINPAVPRRSAWILKKYILPMLYWDAMLKGREWLARPASK